MNENALTTQSHTLAAPQPSPFALTSFDQVKEMAGYIAEAQMYGIKKPAQAITLMMMAHEEGISVVQLMRRVHVFEDGKISQRADYTQAEFEKVGTIVWHLRTDEECYATFFRRKEISDEDIARGAERCELLRQLEDMKWIDPREPAKEKKVQSAIAKLARQAEDSVIRTIQDADSRGISQGGKGTKTNWATSPRSMLQWRCVTEGVKVVCPAILSGLSSDVELQDAQAVERHIAAKADPTSGERDDIIKMIAMYDEQLNDAKGGHRQAILGARMELVTKLADMGVKAPERQPEPATVAGRPVKMAEAAEVPATPTPTPTPAPEPQKAPAPATRRAPVEQQQARTEPVENLPWQEVVCHVGPNPGQMFDKTLAEIFARPKTTVQLDRTVKWFQDTLGGSPIPKDVALWKAVEEARAAWKAPESAHAPANAPTASETPKAEAPKETATPTDWRAFVIEVKTPDYAGKKLGEIDLKAFSADYLDKIDPARATLHQKKLKALVCQALAETAPKNIEVDEVLPPAANDDEPEHTKQLRGLIEVSKLNRNSFMSVCRANGYISSTATRLEDITETEFTQLASEWPEVSKEVTADQP